MKRVLNLLFTFLAIAGFIVGIISLSRSYYRFIVNTKNNSAVRPSFLTKEILFISSYSESYPYTREQMKGFDRVFSKRKIPYDSAFMDMKLYNTPENIEAFYNLLKYKLSAHSPYKVVIAGDDQALRFIIDHYYEFFSQAQVIFIGINDEELAKQAAEYPRITGSVEKLSLNNMFQVIQEFFPETENVAALYGTSTLATLGFIKQFSNFIAETPYKFMGIHSDALPKEEIVRQLQNLPQNTVLVLLGMYNDLEGYKYSLPEMTDLVMQYSTVPTFTVLLETIGSKILGGSIFRIGEAAEYTASLAIKALDGEDISKVSVKTDIPSDIILNWNMMQKFGIEKSRVPKYVKIINQQKHFISEYSFIMYPSLLIITSMTILIIILMIYSLHIRDIKEKLEFQLTHNQLTNLPNQIIARKYIRELMDKNVNFAILMLDIEDFHTINDYYSHDFGDSLLVEIADRLQTLIEIGNYTVYRLHNDKFLLVRADSHVKEKGLEFYYLRQLLSGPFCTKENPTFIKISIGIINSDSEHKTSEEYIIDAEIALYEAKLLGSNKNAVFTAEMRHAIEKRHEIVKDVEFACHNDGFFVMFQPQIITENGDIFGFEALTRLQLTDKDGQPRIIAPGDFIPVAEKSGYISKIGRIITEKTIRQMAEWRNKGLKLHKVSINFSAAQISDYGYVDYLSDLLKTYKISPALICIEITESLFLGNRKQATELFEQFKKLGVKLALDDFGTGYSSLSYLAYLPVDIVKIDKSLVDNYLMIPEKSTFVENIVNLVHSLNMKLVVEGIENRWQYDKIKNFGGDYIQGYYFSKPIMGEEVESFSPTIA